MTQTQWVIIITSAVVLSAVFRIILDLIKSRREKPAYLAVAESLNLKFSEDFDMEKLPRKDAFLLFNRKDAQHIPYLLSGKVGHVEVKILDYVYSVYSATQNRSRPSKEQTLVIFQAPEYRWPDLMMTPESFALKLTKLLGVKDIDIADAPEFSRRYLLNGTDEEAVRGVFRREVTDAFVRKSGWCVEAHGDVIVFWGQDKRVPPQDIRPFFEETVQLFQLMARP